MMALINTLEMFCKGAHLSDFMKNILVTGIGGDIGQSLLKCLSEDSTNHLLIGCDMDKYAGGAVLVKIFLTAPPVSEGKKYLSFIDETIKKFKINAIFPTSESEILFFNENREHYNKTDVDVYINNQQIIETFSDKYNTFNFLKKNGFACPKTFLPSNYSNQLDYPFIIKPRRSSGGKRLLFIRDNKEFDYYRMNLNDDFIVQEYIGNKDKEYTTPVFSNGAVTYNITFRRYLSSEHGGFSKFVELADIKETRTLSERLAKISKLDGSINIQMREQDGKYHIFEINPRISSTVYFRYKFGFKDIKWWMDTKAGKTIKYEPKYSKGIGVKTYSEVFFDLE